MGVPQKKGTIFGGRRGTTQSRQAQKDRNFQSHPFSGVNSLLNLTDRGRELVLPETEARFLIDAASLDIPTVWLSVSGVCPVGGSSTKGWLFGSGSYSIVGKVSPK